MLSLGERAEVEAEGCGRKEGTRMEDNERRFLAMLEEASSSSGEVRERR